MTGSLPGWVFPVGAGIVGLLVGSFLNVVVYRLPLGLSISRPRSFCPTCDRQLEWWENIPVVSWLALRGRCHTCHEPISARYPLVELSTGVSFALVTLAFEPSWDGAGYCVWAATLLSIVLIDIGGARSPLRLMAVGTGAGLAALLGASAWSHDWRPPLGATIGIAVGSAALWALVLACRSTSGQPAAGASAIVILGGWLGGLSTAGCIAGAAAGLLGWLAAVAVGIPLHRVSEGIPGRLRMVADAPLAVAIVVGAAVGIIVGA